jgi:phosphohistidine phosphatase
VLIEDRIYGATAQALWRRIRDLPDDVAEVMLIGHNPGLHELATSLAAEGDDESLVRLRHKLPTCALVTLVWSADSWASLRRTDAVLHDYVRPRDL